MHFTKYKFLTQKIVDKKLKFVVLDNKFQNCQPNKFLRLKIQKKILNITTQHKKSKWVFSKKRAKI